MQVGEGRDLVVELVGWVQSGPEQQWAAGAARLEALTGGEWVQLDGAARGYHPEHGRPVDGARGWLAASAQEPTSFVAAVTSLHVDGRIRQRATLILAERSGPVVVSALALRLLDHVPQVRETAAVGICAALEDATAGDALAVVLAGGARRYGPAALGTVVALLLEQVTAPELVALLVRNPDRRVRRWVFAFAHEYGVLTRELLLDAITSDPDQLIVVWCADWLRTRALPSDFAAMLTSSSVEVVLTAVTFAPDAELPNEKLLGWTTSRSPRIREAARRRAARRGLDVVAWWRIKVTSGSAGTRAACIEGLAVAGGPRDAGIVQAALRDVSSRVRASATIAFAAGSTPEAVLTMLSPLLLDPSPRVTSAAARALGRAGAGPLQAKPAWASQQVWSRQAAWQLMRSGGGWYRVEADLRACIDDDPHLAAAGTTGVRNWLTTGAATTWAVLDPAQRDRIASLLNRWPGPDHPARAVAFHARIPWHPAELDPAPRADEPQAPRLSRWLTRLRRR